LILIVEPDLREFDYHAFVQEELSRPKQAKRKPYQRWSNKERFQIGEYASLHGSSAAVKMFRTNEKTLSETTARRFSKLYKKELQQAEEDERDAKKELAVKTRGRPLLLGSSLDQMVQKCLLEFKSQGGVLSTTIAISAAKALIARNPQWKLDSIDLDATCWAQSLFRRMKFTRKLIQKTEDNVEIINVTKKETDEVSLSMVHKGYY